MKRGAFSRAPATLSAGLLAALSSLGSACRLALPCPFWGFVKNKLKRTDATEAFGDEEPKWPCSASQRRTDGLLHSISSSRSLSPCHARVAELVLCSEEDNLLMQHIGVSFFVFVFFCKITDGVVGHIGPIRL